MVMNNTVTDKIMDWLVAFEDCVHKKDFEKGKALFASDCYCFGSVADHVPDINTLAKNQWMKVWPNIKNFKFNPKQGRIEISRDQSFACVTCPWTSTGIRPDGSTYRRPGRVTILLVKNIKSKKWLAHHTHYSLNPQSAKGDAS